jgi:hypothetical protein
MFDTICKQVPVDNDYPARVRRLDILGRVFNGTIYDVLPYDFGDERSAGGEYVPLRWRKPAVRCGLCRVVVEDSVALLFSEGHFPRVDCADEALGGLLSQIARETRLNQVMIEAAQRGAVGSVAILMRVLRGRIFFSVHDTMFLTPQWDPQAPDTLKSVVERYKVAGVELAAQGYEISDPAARYWFERRWDDRAETWFVPQRVDAEDAEPVVDPERSTEHRLGFVPIVWIRNLPGGDEIDGGCTFRAAVETAIEIDYQLSQAGRGLKYSSDPTLLIKEPATSDTEIVKSAGNALVVSEKGDAKLLEIGGTASAAVIDYVRTLREMALESVHGNRADPSRLSAASSGRAIELMQQGLVWLADNLRISYGEGGLLALMNMVLRASQRYQIRIGGALHGPLDTTAALSLKWPRWTPSTADDRAKDAQSLATLAAAGQLSRQTAVNALADTYDIADVAAELARIAQDRASEEGKPHE